MSNDNSVEARLARLEERIQGTARALDLQAAEYQRRLNELNHAHQFAVTDRGQYVRREALDLWRRELDTWRELVTKELALNRGKALGATLAMGSLSTVAALVIGHVLKVFSP